MSSLTILGDTSGSVVLQAPSVAGSSTLTLPTTGGTVLSTASTGVCRAWARFNNSGTILGSFNVSSITVNATGYYTVNMTTAMPNTNYSAIATASASTGSNGNQVATVFTNDGSGDVPPTTTAYTLCTGVYGVGQFATRNICTAVFA